jgi:hypothetical protein
MAAAVAASGSFDYMSEPFVFSKAKSLLGFLYNFSSFTNRKGVVDILQRLKNVGFWLQTIFA